MVVLYERKTDIPASNGLTPAHYWLAAAFKPIVIQSGPGNYDICVSFMMIFLPK